MSPIVYENALLVTLGSLICLFTVFGNVYTSFSLTLKKAQNRSFLAQVDPEHSPFELFSLRYSKSNPSFDSNVQLTCCFVDLLSCDTEIRRFRSRSILDLRSCHLVVAILRDDLRDRLVLRRLSVSRDALFFLWASRVLARYLCIQFSQTLLFLAVAQETRPIKISIPIKSRNPTFRKKNYL